MDVSERLGMVDVAFVIDTTGSMGPYIEEARKHARAQADEIAERGGLSMRVAVVEYRDHPPQDNSFVFQSYPFGNGDALQAALGRLTAGGGGDRPEAVYDGLIAAAGLDWRKEAECIAFLIGDSPPHNPCLCRATPGGVVELLGSKQITLHAFSIAGYPDTTLAFRELTDALGGVTTEAERPEFAVATGTAILGVASSRIGETRSYYAAASLTPDAGVEEVAKTLGWSTTKVALTQDYLASRGIEDPLAKPKRTRGKNPHA